MDTIVPNVMQMFGLPVQYTIPSYQRNYVWNRNDHWLPLWEDVERIASARATHDVDNESRDTDRNGIKPHFFGTLITKQTETVDYVQKWVVIDGQQRLTTLQLLISAAARVLRQRDLQRAAAQLSSLVVNPDHMISPEGGDELKIEPKGKDYASFTGVMHASANDDELDANSSIGKCHKFFEEKIDQWLNTRVDDIGEAALALSTTLQLYLQFVEIRLKGGENEYMIFETLNARGEPLTEWEKSKNYLLSVAADLAAEGKPVDEEIVYREYIDDFDERDFWRTEVVRARFRGPRSDLFFDYWMQIELGRRASPTRLYREFRIYVEDNCRDEKSYVNLMRRLSQFASVYMEIETWPNDNSPLGRFNYRTRALQLEFFVPVLMVLRRRMGDSEIFDASVAILESYVMRRAAVFVQNRGVDAVSRGLVNTAKQQDNNCGIPRALAMFLKEITSAGRWPTDDEIIDRCRDREFESTADITKSRLMLEAVASRLTPAYASVPFDRRTRLTVEHIVPREWEKHWRVQDESLLDLHGWRLGRLTRRIGNLTLVTQSLNSKMSNRSWDRKRELLAVDNLYLNRDVIQHVQDDCQWDEDQINARGQRLARFICDIWPRDEGENPDGQAQNDG